jgi:hypothetical protein
MASQANYLRELTHSQSHCCGDKKIGACDKEILLGASLNKIYWLRKQ